MAFQLKKMYILTYIRMYVTMYIAYHICIMDMRTPYEMDLNSLVPRLSPCDDSDQRDEVSTSIHTWDSPPSETPVTATDPLCLQYLLMEIRSVQ